MKMEITSIRIRCICHVCATTRTVICEPHKLARHILMPIEGTTCTTRQCIERLPPFLYILNNIICAPSSESIERFNALRGAFLHEATLYERDTTLTVGFSTDSVAKAEMELFKIKQRIQKYEEAKAALVRFFNEFLP